MIDHSEAYSIGYSDYGDVHLKRVGDHLILKRYHPLDYEYMEDYIRDNHSTLSEWQEAVYDGNTEQSYNERMENYEYDYDSYFDYDSDTEEYYDTYDSDCEIYSFNINGQTKEEYIEYVMDDYIGTFDNGGFTYYDNWNEERFTALIGELYDKCLEYREQLEEDKKPHWKVFNYYK